MPSRLRKNFILTLLLEPINKFVPFYLLNYSQRTLGLEALGFAQFLLSVFELVPQIMNGGLQLEGSLRLSVLGQKSPRFSEIIGEVWGLRLILGILSYVLFGLALSAQGHWPQYGMAYLALFVFVPFSAIDGNFVQVATQETGRYNTYLAIGKIAALIAILYSVKDSSDAALYAFLCFAMNALCSCLSGLEILARFRPRLPSRASFWPLFKAAWPYTLIATLLAFYERSEALSLEFFWGREALGLWSGPWRLAQALWPLVVVFSTVFFSAQLSERDPRIFEKHTRGLALIFSLSLWPILWGSVFTAGDILGLVLGVRIESQASLFSLFLATQICLAFSQIYGMQVLILKGQRKWVAFTLGFVPLAAFLLAGLLSLGSFSLSYFAGAMLLVKALVALAFILKSRPYFKESPWVVVGAGLPPALIMAFCLWGRDWPLLGLVLGGGLFYSLALVCFFYIYFRIYGRPLWQGVKD